MGNAAWGTSKNDEVFLEKTRKSIEISDVKSSNKAPDCQS